jgi:hypothetical protein
MNKLIRVTKKAIIIITITIIMIIFNRTNFLLCFALIIKISRNKMTLCFILFYESINFSLMNDHLNDVIFTSLLSTKNEKKKKKLNKYK